MAITPHPAAALWPVPGMSSSRRTHRGVHLADTARVTICWGQCQYRFYLVGAEAQVQPGPITYGGAERGSCGGSYHTDRHPGSRQVTAKCPQMAWSSCGVWAPGHKHRCHTTSTRSGPNPRPFWHRAG